MSNALQLTAQRLIAANGASVTFSRVVEGAYNEVTGSAATTTTTATAYAVLDNYSGSVLRSGIEVGDKRLWVAGIDLSFDLQPGDTVSADGVSWAVISVNKINPDGNTYLYDVQVRR